jgi:hypothetical protein
MDSIKQRAGKMLLSCFFLFVFIPQYAQDSVKVSLKTRAGEYFVKKDYTHSLPLYRELLYLYPRDPYYQYQTALCLLNLNQSPEEEIDLLRVVSYSEENPLATFYLGRAFHLHYDFDDAIKAYSRFLTIGKKADIKRLKVQRLIEMAKNGIDLTRNAKTYTVKNSGISPLYQIENAYSVSTNGKVIRKPSEFNSKYDQKMNFSSLIYLPVYTEINEYIYVSGYEETGKKGKDIFRIKNINHQNWSLPEPLNNAINTPFDEDFPFFDTRTSTLYFSSEGHSSMGGYDIFKSVYDWNTKTWSKPENVGFPINSPYDDFMLVTDESGQTAQFASNRSTGPGMVMLYRISLKDNEEATKLLTVDEIREISALRVSDNPVEIPEEPAAEIGNTIQILQEDNNAEMQAPVPFNKNEYNLLIAEALTLQLKADSLARIARDQRIIARETPDDEAKKQLISEILSHEREAKKIQREADEKFKEAGKMKNLVDTISGGDPNLVLNKEINGIREYQYTTTDTLTTMDSVLSPVPVYEENTTEPSKTPDVSEFEVVKDSPYNLSNPIPPLPAASTGLIYRIQLGVFSRPKEVEAFGGLTPLFSEWLSDRNVYKYYTGSFSSSESVATALEKVRSKGFPDAFVVAFYNAKPVTTEKAREIEFAGLKL